MELCKAPLQFLRTFRPRPVAAPAGKGQQKEKKVNSGGGGGGGGGKEGGDAGGGGGSVSGSGPGTYMYLGGISFWRDMWITIDRRAPVV